MAREKELMTE